jgi:hypothetical protein
MSNLKVNISNPSNYTKDGKVRVKFTVTGSKEAVAAFQADQTAKAGHECSKDSKGNPMADFAIGTASKYGVSNVLEMITLQDGTIGWQAENSEQTKLREATLADESTPAYIKASIQQALVSEYMEFEKVCANNRKIDKDAYIKTLQSAGTDAFTKVK